ncbi:MAG: hypothetical protein L0J54_00010 [Halomonas sp.]|nr:hypothetical protein [Halomonas sp.]MDN6296391.1 hypothetical protein [Halomonas sp.]MDN6313744.1 hypothetical protein [Halomonas sp.]MDN6335198.1 hypothetical protein [Halomonas sp.]
MRDLAKRAIVPMFAALLLLAGLIFLPWGWPLGLLMLVTRAIIRPGVHDWFQTRWTIARNYPVAG